MAITKPSVLPAWAESGDKVTPSNAEIQVGWPLSSIPPSRQRFNWLLNYLANAVRYFSRRGIPDYDAAETYMIGDRIIGDDGKTYRSLIDTNLAQTPSTSPTKWEEWAPTLARFAALIQGQTYTAFTTAGAAPNFTLTPSPAITAYAAGQRFRVKFHAIGAGADQLNVSALGNKALKQYDNTGAKVAAVPAANQLADVEYDGVDMVLLDPLPPSVSVVGGVKNRIINGGMAIDQRNAGAAVTPTASGYTIDRWQAGVTQASKLTFQRVSDAPAGAAFSLKATVASQYAPVAADIFNINQPIEGNNVVDLQFGTAGALQITTSFQVKASVAGTYSCGIHNGALNRSYVATYTIASANTWTPLVITISGDQTGTWTTDNTTGLWIDFDLGSGSNANAAAGAWGAGSFKRTAGSVTFVNQTAGATWQLAQVQIERGAVSSPAFEPRAFGAELSICQRYYEKSYSIGVAPGAVSNGDRIRYWNPDNQTIGAHPITFSVRKRTNPTVAIYSPATGASGKLRNETGSADIAANAGVASDNGFSIAGTFSVAQIIHSLHFTADAEL